MEQERERKPKVSAYRRRQQEAKAEYVKWQERINAQKLENQNAEEGAFCSSVDRHPLTQSEHNIISKISKKHISDISHISYDEKRSDARRRRKFAIDAFNLLCNIGLKTKLRIKGVIGNE